MILRIKVKPNARSSGLEQLSDGSWQAQVKSPPTDGKANAELIALVASHFDVGKRAVTLKSGAASRWKLVEIDNS